MPGLRDEITNTLRRLRGVPSPELDETAFATDPREGRHYGNYRVLRRLGAGGMGHVYLAMDTHLGRHSALKFLSPKLKSNPDMLARLQQEARTASSLNHPNILTIYDIAEAEGEPFIASEFIEGVTLRQALARGAVEPHAALDCAIQIASALVPAHAAGVIHRDLKPGNIMLRPDGLIKVIDFGLAKFTAQGHVAPLYEPVSDPGSVAGTVQYMSPEQARGEPVDSRSDLWSLGVMLYEMVALKKPFDGETDSHIIVAILDQPPAALKPATGVPAGLAHIVEKALAKSPDKRYQTAREMLDALQGLEAASRTRSSKLLRAAWLQQRTRRLTRAAIWLAALAAASAGFAIWWWPFHGRESVLGPPWFTPGSFTQVTHRGDVNVAALAPDGKHVAYTTSANGLDQLHLLNLATHTEFAWQPAAGDMAGLSFSPDSATVYYNLHDQHEWRRLYSAQLASPDPAFVLDDVDGPITFAPDGKEFAFHRKFDDKRTNRESIVIAQVHDTGSQQIVFTKTNTFVGSRIAWLPSGVMAVTLSRQDLQGNSQPTVLFFTRDGKELQQQTDQRLRLLSGPAAIDDGSILMFGGFGRSSDASQATVIEMAVRSGEFRFFASPVITPSSMTASSDFQQITAVTSARKSALWVAAAETLDSARQWSSDDSFDSLTWSSDVAIVHASPKGGIISLWETTSQSVTRPLPHHGDCASQQPAMVPGIPTLVFSSNCGASAYSSNLWMLNTADGTVAPLTDHSFTDQKPALSSDGDTVLYNSWPNNSPALMKISLRTRLKSQFSPLHARNAAISPDGRHVACQVREVYDGQWRAAILSMRDGVIEKDNLPLPNQLSSVVRWSAQGDALDYVDAHDSANIWRFSLAASSVLPLTHLHGNRITDFAWNRNGTQLAWVSSDVRHDVIIFNKKE